MRERQVAGLAEAAGAVDVAVRVVDQREVRRIFFASPLPSCARRQPPLT